MDLAGPDEGQVNVAFPRGNRTLYWVISSVMGE